MQESEQQIGGVRSRDIDLPAHESQQPALDEIKPWHRSLLYRRGDVTKREKDGPFGALERTLLKLGA